MGIDFTPFSDDEKDIQESLDAQQDEKKRLIMKLKENNTYHLRFIGKLAYLPEHNLFAAQHLFMDDKPFPKVVLCQKEKSRYDQEVAKKVGRDIPPLLECPLCQYVEFLRGHLDEKSRKLAKEIEAKSRFFWYALWKKKDGTIPKCISLGPSLKKELLKVFSEWGNFTPTDGGYDVYIKVTPQKGSSILEYAITPATMVSKDVNGRSMRGVAANSITKEEMALCSDLPDIDQVVAIRMNEEIWDGLDLSDIAPNAEEPAEAGEPAPAASVQKNAEPQTPEEPQPEKQEVKTKTAPKPQDNLPKCFGNAKLYDPDDEMECGKCQHKKQCAAAVAAK